MTGLVFVSAPQGIAHAQVMTPPIACISLTNDIYYGSTDYSSGNEVTTLQTYLQEKAYFPYSPVGVFGPLTFAAVKRFQEANGVNPTGYVGPITRGVIENLTCSSLPPNSSVSIQSLYPTSGSVGTQVTITGYGFTSNNTILFGGGPISNIPVTSTMNIMCTSNLNCGNPLETLTFTVPSSIGPNCTGDLMCPEYVRLVGPGTYTVSVENANGTSNSETFTVTSGNGIPGLPLTINGIQGPAELSPGETGTWTVNVGDTGASTNLQYSVRWGDEVAVPYQLESANAGGVQSSATFTHAYENAGTYAPIFTVSNASGQSATVTSTVIVN